jgi:predicted GNAT family N-acyltransferase
MRRPAAPQPAWEVTTADTAAAKARCFEIRRVVFIEEQGVPAALELDDDDARALHVLALPPGAPLGAAVGTARLLPVDAQTAKAQRVAVLLPHRKAGVGAALMAHLEGLARRQGHRVLTLGAQLSAVPFYERLGYHGHGDVFLDAGIEHRQMSLVL